jgi:hypothetical protein
MCTTRCGFEDALGDGRVVGVAVGDGVDEADGVAVGDGVDVADDVPVGVVVGRGVAGAEAAGVMLPDGLIEVGADVPPGLEQPAAISATSSGPVTNTDAREWDARPVMRRTLGDS